MLKGAHTPVFCILDIPEATLDYFLQCIENRLEEQKTTLLGIEEFTVSDEVVFITNKDVSTITSGATKPAKAFTSPFLGETLEQVRDWFVDNIAPIEDGYTYYSFLILDSQTVEDNTCLLVNRELQTIRCDPEVAQKEISSIEFGSGTMLEDDICDYFIKTGEVMTKERYDLLLDGRLYIEDGKLK